MGGTGGTRSRTGTGTTDAPYQTTVEGQGRHLPAKASRRMTYSGFLRENARWLAGGFLLTFFSSFGQTFFISLSAGGIREDYELSHGEFGLLYMLATLGSALSLPYVGRLVDFASVSKTVLLIVPALALACIAMGLSGSIILLVVVLYFLRLFGQGMMTHTSLTAMGRWYSSQRGRAVSVAVIGHQAGEAILPVAFISLLLTVGWRETWFLSAGFLLLFALPVIYLLMRVERVPGMDGPEGPKTSARNWTRSEVVRDRLFWLLILGVLAPSFIGTTIFFHQIHLVELRNWAPESFAFAFTVMAVMTFCFALVSGFLIDRFSAVALLPFFLLPLASACLVLAFFTADYSMFVFMGLLGISYGFSSTLFGALWPEVYGVKHLGSVRSLIISMMVFGTALGPGLTGYLIDIGVDYPLQIAFMGVYCLAASGIMLFVSRQLKSRQAAETQ